MLQAFVVLSELAAAEHAAVDDDIRGVDVGGAVGGEPQHALGDVVREAGAGDRRVIDFLTSERKTGQSQASTT